MKRLVLLFVNAMMLSGLLRAQSSFTFNGVDIDPGTKQHFKINIIAGKDSTFIPVTVFNGIENGETLGITAGIHGYEYAPILGAQKLIKSIDPARLKGVVILVQVANLEGFLGRSPYLNPLDKKNLNRSFPGEEEGTITSKIAHYITENIISRADYFLDMHSGDAPEDLMKYAAYYSSSSMPEVTQKGREMAMSLGFEHIVVFDTNGKAYMEKDKPSLYTTAEAFKRGIPSIDIECGRLGLIENEAVSKIEDAVLNLLGYLKFTQEKPRSELLTPLIISKRIYIESGHDGFFYPQKKAGDYVIKGMKLGYVTNLFGEILVTLYAEEDGLILMILSTPPINKGEDAIVLAKVNNS